MAGACALKAFARPILLPHEGEHVESGFQVPETPSKAAVPREPGATQAHLPIFESGGSGEKMACAAFLSRGVLGLLFAPQERVSPCRMQLPEARLGPSVRRGLGAERPSWLRGYGRGLGAEGSGAPNPASARRSTLWEWVSGTGDPQQSSTAQGAHSSPAPLCPWRAECWVRKELALVS